MAVQSTLGAEFERRFYQFAETVIRLAQADPTERAKALETVYGRHLGYILWLLNSFASEGQYADWMEMKPNPNLEKQILQRAKQHLTERQVKQLYR